MNPKRLFLAIAIPWFALSSASAVPSILHTFTGGTGDGGTPTDALTLVGSTLYGMTEGGGSGGKGTVFQMQTDGSGFGLLHSFTGPPDGGPIFRNSLTFSGGALYGMTDEGGGGTNHPGAVFRINPSGPGYQVLHSFSGQAGNGSFPWGTPTVSGSLLYGTTSSGGSSGGGTVFRMNTDGSGFLPLHDFLDSPTDGRLGQGKLALAGATGYGMTYYGGAAPGGVGTVYRINTDGTGFGLLHSFGFNDPAGGFNPYGSLTLAGSKLYGLTSTGGRGGGTIFSLNLDGSGFEVLHTFNGRYDEQHPDGFKTRGSLTLYGSRLYGMTEQGGDGNYGTIFGLDTDGTDYEMLYSFTGSDGLLYPQGDLTMSADGSTLFGSAGNAAFSFPIVPEASIGCLLCLGAGTLLRRPTRGGRHG